MPCIDHDHVTTGKIRGRAHIGCNKKFYLETEVPVFFHNISKYDAHLFIEELLKFEQNESYISVIPQSSETYMAITKRVILDTNSSVPAPPPLIKDEM